MKTKSVYRRESERIGRLILGEQEPPKKRRKVRRQIRSDEDYAERFKIPDCAAFLETDQAFLAKFGELRSLPQSERLAIRLICLNSIEDAANKTVDYWIGTTNSRLERQLAKKALDAIEEYKSENASWEGFGEEFCEIEAHDEAIAAAIKALRKRIDGLTSFIKAAPRLSAEINAVLSFAYALIMIVLERNPSAIKRPKPTAEAIIEAVVGFEGFSFRPRKVSKKTAAKTLNNLLRHKPSEEELTIIIQRTRRIKAASTYFIDENGKQRILLTT